ncbi:hypothetical protein WAI453_011173 [Rhynchosporium graminicola]
MLELLAQTCVECRPQSYGNRRRVKTHEQSTVYAMFSTSITPPQKQAMYNPGQLLATLSTPINIFSILSPSTLTVYLVVFKTALSFVSREIHPH